MPYIWHNGEFKDEREGVFRADDRVRLGDGIFDTMLAICEGGLPRLCHANLHFERLLRSAQILDIAVPYEMEKFQDVAELLLERNLYRQGRYAINTVITRGPSERGLAAPETPQPQIVMRASTVPETFPPVESIISKTVRRNEGSPLSQIKSCNYGDNILARLEADKAGANEAILLNNAGRVACATVGNVFVMINGTLYTPPLSDGAMAGIVRGLLLQHHGAQEKSLSADDLQNAQGVYIGNSIRGLVPVKTLDERDLTICDTNIPQDFHE